VAAGRGALQSCLACVERILDALLGGIDQRTDLRALFGGNVAQGLHHLGQLAFLAKIKNPDLLQGIDVFAMLHGL